MRATWRQLPVWPYPPAPKSSVTFRADWNQTMRNLEEEIERIKGRDVLIGVVADDSQFMFDGTIKAGFKVKQPGAEVSFDTPKRGRLVFHTDTFPSLQENLRAISLGLTALRAIERYAITTTAEQYAGFQQLSPGGPDVERGRVLVEKHGTVAEALKRTHPDQGGDPRQLADVQAYRKSIGAAAR